MAIIESSITINKPVEKVFEYITDVGNPRNLNQFVSAIEVPGPLKVGMRYVIKIKTAARTIDSVNEVVAFEPNKKFSVKTIAQPPASDVTNTYLLEKAGTGTKLTVQMDTVVMAMGMEAMVTNQLKASQDTNLASIKKGLEG